MIKNDLQDDELIRSFVLESRDMVDEAEPYLIDLSQSYANSEDEESINVIFRLFHSIKGSASFLKFHTLSQVTHEAETLLQQVRDGLIQISESHVELLIQCADMVRQILNGIDQSKTDTDHKKEADRLIQLMNQYTQNIPSKSNTHNQSTSQKNIQPKSDTKQNGQTQKKPIAVELSKPLIAFPAIEIPLDTIKAFAEESFDFIENAIYQLDHLDSNSDNTNVIDSIFRSIHNFKGNSGALGYYELERLIRMMETVLGEIVKGTTTLSDDHRAFFIKILSVLKECIQDIEAGGKGTINGLDVIINLFNDMLPDDFANSKTTSDSANQLEWPLSAIEKEMLAQSQSYEMPSQSKSKQEDTDFNEENDIPNLKEKEKDKDKDKQLEPSGTSITLKTIKRSDIRVDLTKLDVLINLVGELVIAESMVTKNPDLEPYEFENFDRASRHLNRIVRDLQDVSMSIRMIPIAATFKKMIRVVHDVASKARKKARLIISGENTEVDKTVAELIQDPLVHIIRNAIDHGIETPERRIANGKDEVGTISIEARHESGEVWIVISDDGQGVDKERIIAKGIELGLIEGDGLNLADDDIYKLVFEPGFSTASKITDISGRGVGMDVVKKNIEKLKGRIDIRSTTNFGSTIIIRIPLTLSIIDGMLVRVGNACYTIPLLTIRESIKIGNENIVKTMDGQEIVKLRDELFPVIRLHELYNIHPDYNELVDGLLIVIQQTCGAVCIFVDEILGQHQAVIKGLSNYIYNIHEVKGISGCTILGNGEISLILDVRGIIDLAKKQYAYFPETIHWAETK